jgi:hypothetical protein
VTVEAEVSQKGKNEKKGENTLLPMVDVVLFALVKTTGTIIATDITLTTKRIITNLHSFILPPPRLDNEYRFRNDLSLLN